MDKEELTENVEKLLDDFIYEVSDQLNIDDRCTLYEASEKYAQEVDKHWDGISLVLYTKGATSG